MNFWIEDTNGVIHIGKNTSIQGQTGLAVIEGTKIEIGEDCMFSSNIVLRTGDSHSVLDLDGKRINPSKDIIVGNHVWVGQGCNIGKGARIPNNSIVGMGSVVTKAFTEEHVAIAGNPAKIIKTNVDWDRKRI